MPAPLGGPASGPQEYSNAPLPPLSWEGEKMFNIYIYDYCFKRGFRKTARELLLEADIPKDSTPPINARQGLLYEWWSVFWVLFQAKSNAQGGTEDAQLYNMHMRERHEANPQARNNPSIPGVPSAVAPQQRLSIPPGVPNGTGPGPSYGQPQHPPGGSPMNFAMGGAPGPQVNGVAGSHPPTPAGGPTQGPLSHGPHPGGPQQPGFHPMMQQQRQLNGPQPLPQPQQGGPSQPQQQRPMGGPNPNMPFHSPTMAASSPNHGSGMPPPQQPSGPQQPPMGNLGGPSPLLGRPGGILPPNGAPPPPGMMIPPQGGSMLPNGTPTPQFQQVPNSGRPPSRTNTPQMQGMMQQSPSMGNRQLMTDAAVSAEFSRLPVHVLQQLKSETDLSSKDPSQFTIQDKRKIMQLHQARTRQPNAAAGPSNMHPNQPPRGTPQQQQQQQQQQHAQQQRGKRPSTSPGEEHETLPRTESSPPDRKRPRRSPTENAGGAKPGNPMSFPPTPQQGPAIPPPQGQPGQMPMGHPGVPQQQGGMHPGMMMMGGRPMGPPGPMSGQMMPNGHIPPPPMMQGQQMQGQPMQGMNPQNPMGHPGQLGVMMPTQMGQGYRVPLHQAHTLQQPPPLNAGSPAGPDSGYNPMQGQPGGPQFANRMGLKPQGGPGVNMMPPPPSPANANKDPKDGKSNPDGSPAGGGQPQNQQQGQPTQGPPQSTPTPHPQSSTPVGQPPQHQGNSGGPPPPQNPGGGPASSPMPNNMMGGPGPGPNPMNSLNNSLVGLDGSMDTMNMFDTGDFNLNGMAFDNIGDNGFDFARDFGQWFNPDDGMSLGADGMK